MLNTPTMYIYRPLDSSYSGISTTASVSNLRKNIEEEPTDLGLLARATLKYRTSSRKNVTKILPTMIKQKHSLTLSM
jgi:hypothetical protein